jgi:hypothetical protein
MPEVESRTYRGPATLTASTGRRFVVEVSLMVRRNRASALERSEWGLPSLGGYITSPRKLRGWVGDAGLELQSGRRANIVVDEHGIIRGIGEPPLPQP